MTVLNVPNFKYYAGDGGTTSFPFPYKAFAEANIKVYRVVGNITTLLVGGYSLSYTNIQNGCDVVFSTAPASGTTIYIERELDEEQTTDLPTGGAFLESVIEGAFDFITMLIQQLSRKVSRAIKMSVASGKTDIEFPSPAANNVIGWDSLAVYLENKIPTTITLGEIAVIGDYSDSIETAITTIGATSKTVIINKAVTLAAGTTIPSNIDFVPILGGRISGTGVTLNVNGPFHPDLYQVFGSGVSVNGLSYARPEWFYSGSGGYETSVASAITASSGNIVFDAKSYAFTDSMVWSSVNARGVPRITTFVPSAAVSGNFLTINGTWSDISGITINGSATTDVVGITLGSAALTPAAYVKLSRMYVNGFLKGMTTGYVVDLAMNDCLFTGNGSNEIGSLLAGYVNIANITNTGFSSSSATIGTGIGLKMVQAYQVNFINCYWESNDKEGIYGVTGADGSLTFTVGDGCWFEDNQASEVAPETFYNIVVDGTLSTITPALDITIRKASFAIHSLGTKKARIAYFKNIDNFLIEPFVTFPFAVPVDGDLFKFDTCRGSIALNRAFGAWRPNIELVGTNYIETPTHMACETLSGTNRAINSATPDVTIGQRFLTADTAGTTVTGFLGGYTKRFIVVAGTTYTHYDFSSGTSLIGNGGVDWAPSVGDWMECVENPLSFGSTLCVVHEI